MPEYEYIPEGHSKLLDKWMSDESRIVTLIDNTKEYGNYTDNSALYITANLNKNNKITAFRAYYIFPVPTPGQQTKKEYQLSVDIDKRLNEPMNYENFKLIVGGLCKIFERRFNL
jgi:hypothetical protein